MVKIGLQFSANLENLSSFKAGEDFVWYLKLKCMSCGEEGVNWHSVEADSKSACKGGPGSANLVIRCKLCSRENSLDVIPSSLVPYTADDSPGFKTIVAFDCRGVEPVAFDARDGFEAVAAESGSRFAQVKLEDNEWADYDEKAKQTVGVYELTHRFVKLKH
ncbi:hypothetical protein HPB47_025525 [Ixodes persulcatus]|uniref:Uncharacterized protein n=1 Tax=Ixodes persulcatus TaxID=34615 RepID=A0AC60Q325_IXOPE|nr:hypothetical protein HPB47_025525 [Ixodes persulcatus]